jgi:hypothetical protein
LEVFFEYIWKEQPFYNGKHNEKFYNYEKPKCFACFHICKAIIVKHKDRFENIWEFHGGFISL